MCTINPFRVQSLFMALYPGLSLRSNRWAGISERLRRYLLKFEVVPNEICVNV